MFLSTLTQVAKGGPEIKRAAINRGTYDVPLIQVDLHLVCVNLILCETAADSLTTVGAGPTVRRFYSKTDEVNKKGTDFLWEMKKYGSTRVWVKADEEPEGVEGGHAPLPGRRLTSDKTDVDGAWTLIPKFSKLKFEDLVGDRNSVNLVVESGVYAKPFPLDAILDKWKGTLRVGDTIDARMSNASKQWNEAVVTAVDVGDVSGDIGVHFLGWSAATDEVIPAAEVPLRIASLFSQTVDWRSALEEGSIAVLISLAEYNVCLLVVLCCLPLLSSPCLYFIAF